MSREGRRGRVWSWPEGHLGPGFEPAAQMQVIIHVMVAYGAIRVHEARICIQELGPWVASQCCLHQLIYLLVIHSKWVRVLAPWKQAQLHNGFDATGHLLCCVAVVIGAQPDQHNLGADVF